MAYVHISKIQKILKSEDIWPQRFQIIYHIPKTLLVLIIKLVMHFTYMHLALAHFQFTLKL